MVTVAQLRAHLDTLPPDAYVVLAKDPEGNGFSPLARNADHTIAAAAAWYVPECTWAGEIEVVGPDSDGETYEPEAGRDLYAVVLDPVN